MDFGLGLILSFTDNATAGINNAVNSLNQLTQVADSASASLNDMASLSALSVVSNRLGGAFLNAGTGILGMFSNLIGKTQMVGSEFENFRVTLNALYQDEQKAEQAISRLLDFSVESPFEVDQVKDMLIVLQSQGIDAFNEIEGGISGARQETLSWIADLMSFKPDEATTRWKRALTNYIGSGEVRMLRNILDMGDIDQILGHDIGATVEERVNDIVEIVENKNLTHLAQNLALTWKGVSSNISDAFTKIYKSVADNGVFNNLKSAFMGVSGAILSLDNEQLEALGATVAEGLNIIVKPITIVAEKVNGLIMALVDLCQTNPELVKWGMVLGAVAGIVLVAIGLFFKITSALSGFVLMIYASGNSFKTIGGVFASGLKKMLKAILPFTAVIGLLALAWKGDFAGIKTNTTKFVERLINSFKIAKIGVGNSVKYLRNTLQDLRGDNFFVGLTRGIMRVMQLSKSLADAWGDYTLSEENYLKAKELGILPLIEAILDLKYRFGFFKQGFIQGWQEIGNKVKSFFGGLKSSIDGTIFEDMLSSLTDFFDKLSNNDTESWKEFGKTVGELTAKLFTAGAVVTLIGGSTKKLSKTFSGLFSVIKPIFGLITAHPVIALVVGLVGALALLYAKCEPFREFVNELFGTIQQSFSSIIEPMKEVFLSLLISAIPIVVQLIEAFKQFIPQILPFITQIGELVTTVIGSVMQIAIGILPVIMNIVGTVISTIVALMPTFMNIFSAIMSVVQAVIPIVTQLIGMLTPFIVQLVNLLGQFVANILPIIVSLINEIVPIITNIIALILPMIQDIVTNLMPVIQTVLNVIISLVMKLLPIIQTVVGVVAKIIAMAVKIAAVIIPVIVQIVQTIVSVLIPIIDVIIATIGFIADKVVGFVQIVISVISMIATILVGIIEVVVSIIGVIVQYVMQFFSTAVGIVTLIVETVANIIKGIITVAQTIWDGIVSVFSGVIDFFTGIFETVFDVVSGVFTKIGEFFTNVWNGIVTAFNTLGDTISGAIKGAINSVLSGAVRIINGFISAINLAIGIINAIPGISISKLTTLTVPQLATGGVVDKPTTAIIGEAGAEAVMPLENNLGWIDSLATMITAKMTGNIVPSNSSAITNNTNQGDNNQRYLTNNNTSNTTYEGNTDNSVIFNAGAIQVNVQNASEEEALKFAKKILEYIKRQKELDRMLCYA